MPRLGAEQWQKARAEYEAREISLREVAKKFGVSPRAVAERARKEGWEQGKSKHLVDKKVCAIKALAEYGVETKHLPFSFRHTIETVAQERLQAEGLLATFDVALVTKGAELVEQVTDPEDFELLARGRKHLAPQEKGTTVNVNQQQANISASTPRDALAEITRQACEYPDEERS